MSTAASTASPWLPTARLRPNAPARLFCLPYAGAGASVFRGWADLLPQLDVLPVQLPGRENRIGEAPTVDVDALASALAPFTDRPYAVFGHSFGARLGFELCRNLVAGGAPAPRWLFVSGFHAPQLPRLAPPASLLPEDEFIARVSRLGGTPPEIFQDPDMRALALPVLRSDLAYADDYVYQPQPALPCPLTVFAGEDDTETRLDDLHAWREHTASAFAARVLPGDHFFLHSARRRLLASIAADLATGPLPVSRISVPVLEPGEVHVWHAAVDELALDDTVLRGFLSTDEVDRADRFRFTRDASRFVRRRWFLRRLLAAYGAESGTTSFPTGPNGKPSPPATTPIRFNTSSSAGLAVIAVARDVDMGVDVERLRRVDDRELLMAATMRPEEQTGLQSDEAFLRLWTLKEAYMKALGTGLSLEPMRITTAPDGPNRWKVASSACPPQSVVAVDAGERAVASLAVPESAELRVRSLALTPGRLS